MPKNRFVDPTVTHRLELSDCDWLEVRDSLTWGEELRLTAYSRAAYQEGGALGLAKTWDTYKIEEVAAWVLDWSFCDADGQKVPFSKEALAELDPASGDELLTALNAYVRAKDESPKVANGENASEPVSIS